MKKFEEALFTIAGENRILKEEPMAKHTTFRVGGVADYYAAPEKEMLPKLIQCCLAYDVPYMVIGNGSNLLVSDSGIRGMVIEIGRNMSDICVEDTLIRVQAGALLSRTANEALANSLSGMEFAAGIPGCVGGAVVMNAGAYGGEIKDIIKTVTVLTKDGVEKKLSVEELDLSYRHSCIPQKEYIVIETELSLAQGKQENIQAKMNELKEQRNAKQPLEYPSAGSTFKRPEGYFAGKLVMDAGLRGFQIGGAAVSEKHCGFLINKDKASAADVYHLIQEVQKRVEQQFGVRLEPEVKMVGDFT